MTGAITTPTVVASQKTRQLDDYCRDPGRFLVKRNGRKWRRLKSAETA